MQTIQKKWGSSIVVTAIKLSELFGFVILAIATVGV